MIKKSTTSLILCVIFIFLAGLYVGIDQALIAAVFAFVGGFDFRSWLTHFINERKEKRKQIYGR